MKILFDTNVVLDVLAEREPYAEHAIALFVALEKRLIKGYLCATTITTLDYLLSKSIGREKAKQAIIGLFALFEICPVNKDVLVSALQSSFSDFEDAVLYFSGRDADIDGLVTRNTKDFVAAQLTIYSPEQLVNQLRMGNDE